MEKKVALLIVVRHWTLDVIFSQPRGKRERWTQAGTLVQKDRYLHQKYEPKLCASQLIYQLIGHVCTIMFQPLKEPTSRKRL